ELEKFRTKPDAVRLREVINASEPSICFVYVESYVQPPGTKDRTVIARSEGSGFAIDKDTIAASKHVLQPWKYDPMVLAKAKKIKEEHNLDVQTYIEIYTTKVAGQTFVKSFDTAAGTV